MRDGLGLLIGAISAIAVAVATIAWMLPGGDDAALGAAAAVPPDSAREPGAAAPLPPIPGPGEGAGTPPADELGRLLELAATAAAAAEFEPPTEAGLVALAARAARDASVLERIVDLIWADGTSERLRLLLMPILAVGRDSRAAGDALARAVAGSDARHLLAGLNVAGLEAEETLLVAQEGLDDPWGPPFWRTWHQAFLGAKAYDGTDEYDVLAPPAWSWLTAFQHVPLRPGEQAMFEPIARAARAAWPGIEKRAEMLSAAVSILDHGDPADRALVEDAFLAHHHGSHVQARWFLLDAGDAPIDDCLRRVILHPNVRSPGKFRPLRIRRPGTHPEADRIDRLVNRLLEERYGVETSAYVRKEIIRELAHQGGAGQADSLGRLAAATTDPEIAQQILRSVTHWVGQKRWTLDEAKLAFQPLLAHADSGIAAAATSALAALETWEREQTR